jgi:hypothetical protein
MTDAQMVQLVTDLFIQVMALWAGCWGAVTLVDFFVSASS